MPVVNPAVLARAQRRKTSPQSIGAPVLGWNTRDPFEAMQPTDAILCDNWIPGPVGLATRGGSLTFASGMGAGGYVSTLAPFQVAGSVPKLLAAADTAIYDITDGGATPPVVRSGLLGDNWRTAIFNGHQFWANGIDVVKTYDGTTMADAGFTGVSLATLSGVGGFNGRLYFWTGNDPGFWYGGVNSITGSLSHFDLSTVQQLGGNLIDIEVLSYDGGTGISAYTCMFMSSGEVLLYSGSDPANANNWALVGRYIIPAPVSGRAITRYGGDIYISTASDHFQLSKLFLALKIGSLPELSKVSGAVARAYTNGATLPGWQAIYYPKGGQTLFNIPNVDGTFSQHVYVTATQAWCRLKGWNARCWANWNGKLYFGAANGVVKEAFTGHADDGAAILSQAQQAWQLFETPLKKRVALVRPVVQSQGIADFSFGIGFDYQPSTVSTPDSTISTSAALIFGVTAWGAPHVWGGSGVTDPRWLIATGEGAAVGMALTANTKVGATWVRTDFMLEPGAAL